MYTAAALHPTLNRAQQALVKTDMETSQSWLWCKHDRYYAGEPAFIPKQKSQPISPPDAWVSHQHDQLGDLAKIPCKKQQQQQQQQQNCQSDVQLQEQLKRLKRQQQTQVGPQRSEYTACHLSSESLAEDEGWLMALCYDAAAHCSELVVLDAQRIEAGPITILPLRKTIPHGLHGNWSNEYFGP